MWDRQFDRESLSCRHNSGFIGAMWASYPAFSKGNTAQNKKNLFCICVYTDVKQVLREHRIKLVRKICKQIQAGFILCFRKEEVGICPHGTGRIHMKMSGFNQLLRQHHNRQVPHRKRRTRPRCNFQRQTDSQSWDHRRTNP